jgi:hypothetical protein
MRGLIRRALLLPWIFAGLLHLAACGSDSPKLSMLTLSRDPVYISEEFYLQADVAAPLGDIDRGQIEIEAKEKDTDVDLATTVDVTGVGPNAVSAHLIVGITLSGAINPGRFELKVKLKSNGGRESDEAKISFDATFPGLAPVSS